MQPTTNSRTKYKHIVEFSEIMGLSRVHAFRLLENKSLDTVKAYEQFRKEKESIKRQETKEAEKILQSLTI